MIEHMFAVCLWRGDGHLVRCLGVFYRVSVWSSQGEVLAVYGLGNISFCLVESGGCSGCLWT